MKNFMIRASHARQLLSSNVNHSSRFYHSSAQANRGIAIGGGSNSSSVAPSGLSIPASSSSSAARTPFSALRDEINKVGTNEGVNVGSQNKFQSPKPTRVASPKTSTQARKQFNQQQQQQEIQRTQPNQPKSTEGESWSTVSERIRLGQIEEEKQRREKEAELAATPSSSKKGLTREAPTPRVSYTSGQNARMYNFPSTVESQMFVNGAMSLLSQSNPNWQGSVILHRSNQGIESVEVRLARFDETLERLDSLAQRLATSDSSSSSNNSYPSHAFRSSSISQANVTESAMLHSRPRTRSDLRYKIDESVPVAIQANQVPGNEAKGQTAFSYIHQGPVGHVLGTENDSSPSSPIENHFPVPNFDAEFQRKSQ